MTTQDTRPAFTPGPWHVEDEPQHRIAVWFGELGVADTIDMARDIKDCAANAHLIAAAPELYEALNDALDSDEAHPSGCSSWDVNIIADGPQAVVDACTCWVKAARAALAKAEGR